MTAKTCVAIVKGKVVMANSNKARVFTSVGKARKFVANMISNSVRIGWADVEFITFAWVVPLTGVQRDINTPHFMAHPS